MTASQEPAATDAPASRGLSGWARAVQALRRVTAVVAALTALYAVLLVAFADEGVRWPHLGVGALVVNLLLLGLTLLTVGARLPSAFSQGWAGTAPWAAILIAPVVYAAAAAVAHDGYRTEVLHGRSLELGTSVLLLVGLPAAGALVCLAAGLVGYVRANADRAPDSAEGRRRRTRLVTRMIAAGIFPALVLVVLLLVGVEMSTVAVVTTATGLFVLAGLAWTTLRSTAGDLYLDGLRRNAAGGALLVSGWLNLVLALVVAGIAMGATELDRPTVTVFAAAGVLALGAVGAMIVGGVVRSRGRRECGLPPDDFSDINWSMHMPGY